MMTAAATNEGRFDRGGLFARTATLRGSEFRLSPECVPGASRLVSRTLTPVRGPLVITPLEDLAAGSGRRSFPGDEFQNSCLGVGRLNEPCGAACAAGFRPRKAGQRLGACRRYAPLPAPVGRHQTIQFRPQGGMASVGLAGPYGLPRFPAETLSTSLRPRQPHSREDFGKRLPRIRSAHVPRLQLSDPRSSPGSFARRVAEPANHKPSVIPKVAEDDLRHAQILFER